MKYIIVILAVLYTGCGQRANKIKTMSTEPLVTETTSVEADILDEQQTEIMMEEFSHAILSKYRKYGMLEVESTDPLCIRTNELLDLKGLDLDDCGLNAMRFNNWSEEKWLDNNYIRSVRIYLDAYCAGIFKQVDLDKYKKTLQGNFVVYCIEPFLLGGVCINAIMMDNPTVIVSFWVYSSVSDDKIISYDVHLLEVEQIEKTIYTKEELIRFTRENPIHKIW